MGKHIAVLRRCVPPPTVVAFLVALRRTAPVLLVGSALAMQLVQGEGQGSLMLALLLALMLVGVLLLVTVHELEALPQAPLRLLPQLLPPALLSSFMREVIGHMLVGAHHVGGVREKVSA